MRKQLQLKNLIWVLLLVLSIGANATGLTGVQTVGTGKTYSTMTAAINALNTNGVGSGGVTFKVYNGSYSEAFPTITATGTSANPIRFITTGGTVTLVPNIPGSATIASAYYTGDAVITVKGGSYISFSGFTIADFPSATTNSQRYEHGFLFIKSSATGGCQYDSIMNCNISLTGGSTNSYSTGILFTNYYTSTGTSYTIASSTGTNSNNYIYNNTITNCYNGVIIYGYSITSYSATTVPYQDQNNTISNNNITMGGSSVTAYGIYNNSGAGTLTENNNTVSLASGHTTTVYGIGNYYGYNANVTITNNTFTYTTSTTSAVSGTLYGVYNYYCGYNGGGTSGSANVSSNTVTVNLGPVTNSCTFYGVENYYGGYNNVTGGNGSARVSKNSVTVITPVAPTPGTNTGTYYGVYSYYGAYGGNMLIDSNTVKYTMGSTSGSLYGVYNYYGGYNLNNAVTTTSHCDYNVTSNWTNGPASASISSLYNIYDYAGGATTQTCNNNKVQNNTLYGSISTNYCLYNYGYYTTTNKTENDTITALLYPGTSAAVMSSFYGIYHYGAYSISGHVSTLDKNYINNVTIGTTSASALTTGNIYGMYVYYGATTNIFNNNVSNISINKSANTSGVYTALYAYAYNGAGVGSGGTFNIYNNFFQNISAPYSNTSGNSYYGLNGIVLYNYGNFNVYNNTIYLNNPNGHQGTNFSSAGIMVYNSSINSVTLKNNIIYNNSAAGTSGSVCVIRAYQGTAGTVPTWYNSASNNNNFYIQTGSSYYFYGEGSPTISTNGFSTSGGASYFNTGCSTYKNFMSPRDGSSFYELPPFSGGTVYPNNLKVSGTVGSAISRGGTPTTFTTDYFGTTRSSTAPSVGAYEFTGIYASNSAPTSSLTTFTNTGCTNNPTIYAKFSSGNSISKTTYPPRLYYKLSTDSNSLPYVNTAAGNGWKYVQPTSISGNNYTFTMDYTLLTATPGINSTIQYFAVCQDSAASPNFGSVGVTFSSCPTTVALTSGYFPVTNPNQFSILPTFHGGTYTVGVGGDFPNLTATHSLFDTLNKAAIDGNLIVKIISDISEPGTVSLNALAYSHCSGGTGSYSMRITTDGNAHTISDSLASAVIPIYGASNVTIDGKNQLTVFNKLATNYGVGIMLGGGNCQYDSVVNCIVKLNFPSSTCYGIVLGTSINGTTTYTSNNSYNVIAGNTVSGAYYNIATFVGTNNNYNIFANNTVNTNGYYGMYMYSNASWGRGNIFSGNTLGNTSYGLYVYCSSGTSEQTQILNNHVGSSTTPISSYGIYCYNHDSALIQGNEVQYVNYYYGVYAAVSNSTITKNLIHDNYYSYYCYGIYVSNGSTSGKNNTITNNKIYNLDVAAAPTYGGGIGVYVSVNATASNTLIANNFVGNMGGAGYTSPTSVYGPAGFAVGSGTGGVKIYHNSVAMGGSNLSGYSSGTTVTPNSLYGVLIYGNGTVDIRNNIFMDTMVNTHPNYPTKYYSIFNYNANASNLTSDYNVYYFSSDTSSYKMGYLGASYFNGGFAKNTLAAWQSATGLDAHSIFANPHFYTLSDLHTNDSTINDMGTSALLSTVSTDIDGNTRPATGSTYPDPGAAEYTPTWNLGITAINAPNTVDCYGTNDSIQLTIKNYYSRPHNFTNNPSYIRYSVSGVINRSPAIYNIPTSTPSLAPGATMKVKVLNTLSINSYGKFNVYADIHTSGDLSASNDTLLPARTVSVIPAMSGGTYTVGAGGNFATLSGTHGLFDSLNKVALSSPLTAVIISDIQEPGTVSLNTVSYATCGTGTGPYSIRITTDGSAHMLSDSATGPVITLNSASNVTIDGKNQLTIFNKLATSYGVGVMLSGGSCQYDSILNCTVKLNYPTSTSYGIVIGKVLNGSTTYTANNSYNVIAGNTVTGAYYNIVTYVSTNNNYNTFANNTITTNVGYYGMYIYSNSSMGRANTISGNTISGVSYGLYIYSSGTAEKVTVIYNKIGTPTSGINYYGLECYNQDSALIQGNEVQNVNYPYGLYLAVSNSVITKNIIHDCNYSSYVYAIYMTSGSASSINNTITANKIYNINTTGSSTSGGGIGIYMSTGKSRSNTLIANNAIMKMGGAGYNSPSSAYGPAGIFMSSTTGGIKIYHNTIWMGSNLVTGYASGTTTTPNLTYGILMAGPDTVDIRNNMFIDTVANTSAYPTYNYCIFNYNTLATNLTSDYNVFYTANNSNSYFGYLGNTWSFPGSAANNKRTLANWQSATSQDAHSTFILPHFYGLTDAHLNDSSVNDLGTTALLSVVSTDIDGKTRPATGSTYPDAGAVEFTPGIDLGITSEVAPTNPNCYGKNDSITFTIQNYYTHTYDFSLNPAYIRYNVSGAGTISPTIYNIPSTTPALGKGGSMQVTVLKPFTIGAYGTYKIVGAIHATGDVNNNNDSMTTPYLTVVTPTFAGGNYTVGTGGNFATLTGAHGLFDTLNRVAIEGNINVTIVSDINEPGTIKLNSLTYATCFGSGPYRIHITTDGNAHTLTCNTVSTAVIAFSSASNVTIDGKNQLTVYQSSTSSYGVGILLSGGYCQNDSIINCNIKTFSSTNTSYGLIIGGYNAGTSSYTANNSGNVVAGNTISNAYYGMATYWSNNNNNNTFANNNITTGIGYYCMYMYSSGSGGRNNTYTGNTVGGTYYGMYIYSSGISEKTNVTYNNIGTPTAALTSEGLYFYNHDSATVKGNNIQNVNGSYNMYMAVSNSSITQNIIHDGNYGYNTYGMYIFSGTVNGKNNTITNNKIYNLDIAGSTAYGGGVGIYLGMTQVSSHTLVANNVISAMGGGGYTSPTNGYGPAGIFITSGTGGVKVYHNTVALNSNYVTGYSSGTSGTPNSTYGILKYGGDTVDIRNNIFMDTVVNTNVNYPVNNYCIYVSNATMGAIKCDYNAYYTSGATNSYVGYYGSTWYATGSNYQTLASWQSATLHDSNSVFTNPYFNGLNDLHPVSVAMNDKGTTALLSIVNKDIDGNTRPASGSTNPDPGAYEYTLCSGKPTAGTIQKSVTSVCYGTGTVTLSTLGSTSAAGVKYQWRSSANGTTWTNIGPLLVQPTYTDSAKYFPHTYYKCVVTCIVTNQSDSTAIDSVTTSGTVSVSNSNAKNCGTGSFSSTLTASSSNTNYSYTWAPVTSLTSTTATASISVTVSQSSGYVVTATDNVLGCTYAQTAVVLVTPTTTFRPSAIRKILCTSSDTTTLSSGVSGSNFAASSITYQAPSSTNAVSVIDTFCKNGVQKIALNTGTLDDGGWFNLPIGFNFNFFGRSFTKFNLSTNGNIQFGSTGSFSTSYTPGTLPTTTILNFAAVSWCDLIFTTKGIIRYWIQGYAPNRVCVVEYQNAAAVGDANVAHYATCWILLYETTNIVEMHTLRNDLVPSNNVKTLGVNNYNGTIGVAATGRNASGWVVTTPEAWRFTPPSKYSYNWQPSAKISGSNTVANALAQPGVLGKTIYNVAVYDSTSGCTTTKYDTINAYTPTVTFGGGKTALCQSSTTTLPLSFTGVAPYTYSYTDGSSTYSSSTTSTTAHILVGPLSTTTYSIVSMNDINCPATSFGSDTVIVNLHPTANVTGTAKLCLGSTDSVSVALTGAAPWTLTWTDSLHNHTVSGITASPYKFGVSPSVRTNYSAVSLSDANCPAFVLSGNAVISILNRPASVISGTSSICPGKNTTLSVALAGKKPWSLTWSDSITTHSVTGITSSPYTFSVSPAANSKYTVTALNDSICTSINADLSGMAKVSLYASPTGAFSPYTALNICKASSVNLPLTLSGASPWSITYFDGSSTHSTTAGTSAFNLAVTPTNSATYKITSVSDGHGCFAKLGVDSARQLFVLSTVTTSVTPISSTICSSGSQFFTLTGYPVGSGAVRKWQYSTSPYTSDKFWVNFGTNTDTATLANITKTIYVRVLDSASGCTVIASTDAKIKVDSASVLSFSNVTTNSVSLSWTPVVGASGYTIHYGSNTVTTSSTSYTLTGLSACTAYSIYVSPNSSACAVGNSNTISINTLPPAIVLTLDPISGNKMKAHWNGVKTNRYKLYAGTLTSLPTLATFTLRDTSYTFDFSLATGYKGQTLLAYVVLDSGSACSTKPTSSTKYANVPGGGCSTAAPSSLASSSTATSISVSWTGAASKYYIYYKRVSGTGSSSWVVHSTTSTSYTISGLPSSTCYVLYIANLCSASPFTLGYTSVLDTICTQALCSTPTNLVLSNPKCHSLTATWNVISGVSSYSVYFTQTTGAGSPYAFSYRTTSNTFTPTSLSSGAGYSVYIKANCSTGGQSNASNVETMTTQSIGCKDDVNGNNVNAYVNGSFNVYPNPNTGKFVVNMYTTSTAQTATIEVLDVLGRNIYTNSTVPNSNGLIATDVDLNNTAAKGLYVLRIHCGNDTRETKIILQ